ncbi:MAG: hypothetical protein DRQ55_12025 [Planctomycetota bacterium]|nr:MAG: hypothetical protein DRQ55_12025 [Planctomycetota bacterium]
MTIFITGATGLVGSDLVERLAGRVPLRLLVRASGGQSAEERMAALLSPRVAELMGSDALRLVSGDLTAPGMGLGQHERQRLAQELDGVVHLAARTDFESRELSDYQRVNVGGALEVAQLAQLARCPLLLASTAYVAGDHPGLFMEHHLDLGQALRNPYEASKLEAEQAVRRLWAGSELPLAIMRPGIILPDAPRAGLPVGPGPLVHLQLLARLQGNDATRVWVLRYAGDPQGQLNLVPLNFVGRVLERAALAPRDGTATYHLTARTALTIGQVSAAMNAELVGVETRVCGQDEVADFDRYERTLARRCRMYEPYLFLRNGHDRRRLVAGFDGDDGADEAWLRRVFRTHVQVWREQLTESHEELPASRAVRRYFESFLPGMLGRALVPGLASLVTDFTVSVASVGVFRLDIQEGVLESVSEVGEPSPRFDFASDAEAMLEAVTGEVRPSELFFRERMRITGNLYEALSTATALEDFFRMHPFKERVA